MSENYVDIMIRSLKKKEEVLRAIVEENRKQREILEDVDGEADAFDATVEAKSALIEQIEYLDSGFEKMFAHVKETIDADKDRYAEQIRTIQRLIRSITDLSVEIQSQETRNRDLMVSKFTQVKRQVKTARISEAAASQYYRNMARMNLVDPQFLDDKQ